MPSILNATKCRGECLFIVAHIVKSVGRDWTGCFAAAGVWHPDNRALTKIRTAIVAQPEQWKKVTSKLELEGESLTRPPKGFCSEHPLIEDLKRKDFVASVASVALSEEQVCSGNLMKEFTAACRTMKPLVEFTTKALGLKF